MERTLREYVLLPPISHAGSDVQPRLPPRHGMMRAEQIFAVSDEEKKASGKIGKPIKLRCGIAVRARLR
jgi:hypothetical protein